MKTFNLARYKEWRKTIPFTDEQIAAQFERDAEVFERNGVPFMARQRRYRAEQVRKGYLASRDLTVVLDALITNCEICGKKAHYRQGTFGRCSEHRMVQDQHVIVRKRRLERKGAVLEAKDKAFDEAQLRRIALKRVWRLRRRA